MGGGVWFNKHLDSLGNTSALAGYNDFTNHSFQFHYDVHTTKEFWKFIKEAAE